METTVFDTFKKAEELLDYLPNKEDDWESLDIYNHQPHVERLWRPLTVKRKTFHLFFDRIHPCRPESATPCSHPWPSAARILKNSALHTITTFRIRVGTNASANPPHIAYESDVVLDDGESSLVYSVSHPDSRCTIIPIGRKPIYRVMLAACPQDPAIAAETTKTNRKLRALSTKNKRELIERFRLHYYNDAAHWEF